MSLQQQRRFAQSRGRRLSHNYSQNDPTYVTEDMKAHPFVCPASRCTYGFAGHVTKAYVSDSNRIMVAYWSVYGDFSPTLYNLLQCVAASFSMAPLSSVKYIIKYCHLQNNMLFIYLFTLSDK